MGKNNGKKIKLSNLSPHLFWDVDISKLDFYNNKKLIIKRVLNYGLIDDWNIIYKIYGIADIAKIAVSIKDLDIKSISFVSLLSGVPKRQFVCYNIQQ
jgi:hypothetical protein